MTRCVAEKHAYNDKRFAPDVFFKEAVKDTFHYLCKTVELASTQKELLLMQSLQGRAIYGAWKPETSSSLDGSYSYPNASIEDIIRALDLHLGKVLYERQEIINDISKYFNLCLDKLKYVDNDKKPHKHCLKLVNERREPLGGIKIFEGTLISNPLHVLVGAYIGGCLDSAEWRKKAEKKYGIPLHRGISRAVNLSRLKKSDYTLEDLANLDNSNDIDLKSLVHKKIISNRDFVKSSNGYVSAYIELAKGYGVSDDAALLSVGLLFGVEAAFGFLLVDAIDTWDKATPKIYKDGQDEKIGQDIKKRYEETHGKGSFPCTDRDVLNVIYLSSIDEECKNSFPSCSQRRFVEVDQNTGLYPVESHVIWLRSVKEGGFLPPNMKIAFQRISTEKFYNKFKERYNNLVRNNDIRRSYILPNGGLYNGNSKVNSPA